MAQPSLPSGRGTVGPGYMGHLPRAVSAVLKRLVIGREARRHSLPCLAGPVVPSELGHQVRAPAPVLLARRAVRLGYRLVQPEGSATPPMRIDTKTRLSSRPRSTHFDLKSRLKNPERGGGCRGRWCLRGESAGRPAEGPFGVGHQRRRVLKRVDPLSNSPPPPQPC